MRAGRADLARATPSHHGGPPQERSAPSPPRSYFRPPFPGFFRSQSDEPEALKPFPNQSPKQWLILPNLYGMNLPVMQTIQARNADWGTCNWKLQPMGNREATEGTEDSEYQGLVIGGGLAREGFWNMLWA